MLFTVKPQGWSTLAVAALVMFLVAAAFPGISESDRASGAWSERLTKQAEHLEEVARAARTADAWSQRLNGLAAINFRELAELEQRAAGMSDRAIDAWADRLTGIAEYHEGQK